MDMKQSEKAKEIISELKKILREKYQDGIKEIILYGSYARGKAKSNSDIDVLIITADDLNPLEVRDSLSDFLLDVLIEKGELISVIVLPESFFKNHQYPFILNVKREGVRV